MKYPRTLCDVPTEVAVDVLSECVLSSKRQRALLPSLFTLQHRVKQGTSDDVYDGVYSYITTLGHSGTREAPSRILTRSLDVPTRILYHHQGNYLRVRSSHATTSTYVLC